MDGPMALTAGRSLVPGVGLPRPPRGADGATGVRPATGLKGPRITAESRRPACPIPHYWVRLSLRRPILHPGSSGSVATGIRRVRVHMPIASPEIDHAVRDSGRIVDRTVVRRRNRPKPLPDALYAATPPPPPNPTLDVESMPT